MALIRLDKVSVAFGDKQLLDHVDFQLDKGERVALVGINGAGKSTLLKVLARHQATDDGEIWQDGGARIAELSQMLPAADERKVRDVVASGCAETVDLLNRYEALAMSHSDTDMAELERLQHKIELVDGWHLEQKIIQVLERLELDGEQLMSSLSGGWRRRAALGAALVQSPDILLLDEPTNHLDIETIEWLEKQIMEFRGGVLFISHDRSLVERLATRIIELDRGHLTSFPGNYSAYLTQKEKMLEEEERHNALFDKRLAEEEKWIRQGIKARRTRNEGRVRALKDLRVERSQRRDKQGKAKFQVEQADRSGKIVIEVENVNHGYNGEAVLRDLTLSIQRGDRIGLIGPNGVGKSTLLKVLLGQLTPDQGEVKLGTSLNIAYFDQLRGKLDPEKTIIDNISEGRESITINGKSRHIISYLSDFLFSPERARTPVKALSGGECNRVMLAKLFSQPSNLLVLDEPTNDLDIETLELLEEILLEYKGTLLLVSHDRAFLDNVVTSTLVFEGEGKVQEYVGGYEDWLRQRAQNAVVKPVAKAVPVAAEPVKAMPAKKKLSYKLQRELDLLPAQLEALEADIERLHSETSAADFYSGDHTDVADKLAALQAKEAELETLMDRWVEIEAMQ
ncbi:ATP-binding cassette domain-containing protein [Amphritea sp. 1_MG-2023]|uniref:ATP-binding cassette domain-containing protein n=1 Tax=Amphritea sp. 1_MG-2023 TaxID=3062670 RepID=UPI0026E14D40|nr:ATP-binding cassette domain-containing protein [Amphritea sp. 1_MG-2023]MDO6563475.1 ATP-binding cassette domain-containing protein [Amphritea sp. 1_MG-2023]